MLWLDANHENLFRKQYRDVGNRLSFGMWTCSKCSRSCSACLLRWCRDVKLWMTSWLSLTVILEQNWSTAAVGTMRGRQLRRFLLWKLRNIGDRTTRGDGVQNCYWKSTSISYSWASVDRVLSAWLDSWDADCGCDGSVVLPPLLLVLFFFLSWVDCAESDEARVAFGDKAPEFWQHCSSNSTELHTVL